MTEDKKIRVTDKRMFTPEGELREEFRDLEKAPSEGGEGDAEVPAAEPPRPETGSAAKPVEEPSGAPRIEIPGGPPGLGAPGFNELVAILAEPVALYLGDARLPDGSTAENLDAARFHIDLLDVLREKTAGSLTAQESRLLEDVLYQLRLRYVQKSR